MTEEQRDALDKKITVKEYYEALKSFQNMEYFTVEFYLGFWRLVSKTLVDALNYSHQHGELSSSQKQALITQLEKKEKDRRFLKNWRPISLVNVDVKIASKAIARRLGAVMPLLIPANQNGFIKGRSILDAVHTIDDVLEIGKIMMQNESGILLAIDFEKAFDSLNHEFLYQVLQKMGFGPNFFNGLALMPSYMRLLPRA